VGKHSYWLDDLIDFFPTVFWIFSDSSKIKSKRLVYIETINLILNLQEIDMIFVDDAEKEHLNNIQSLLLKCQPIIFLRYNLPISKEQVIFFKRFGYQATECNKEYQVWKFQ
jgi:flavorubredoxin